MSRRWFFASLAAVIAAAVIVATVRDLFIAPPRNVILLTVDSLRADAVSPTLTPCLWEMARDGIRFTAHRGVSAWTAPNVIAILTGISPFEQGVHSRGHFVPAVWDVPLEQLARRAWEVASIQAFLRIDVYRNLGVEIYDGRDAFAWLAERALRGTQFVFWYHYVDVHLPYNPEAPFRPEWRRLLPAGDDASAERIEAATRLPKLPADVYQFADGDRPAIRALYDGSVREFDSWFCGFRTFLRQSGLLRNTLVVLTSDHGEELGERGKVGHASTTHDATLFEEVVRIPLVLWVPGRRGGEIATATDHLDLMPTVFAFLGERSAMPLSGRDLLAPEIPERPWLALTSRAGFAEKDPIKVSEFLAAFGDGPWKAILRLKNDRVEETALYNLADDPWEQRDGSAANSEVLKTLAPKLLTAALARRRPEVSSVPASSAKARRPGWIFPSGDGIIRHADVRKRLALSWSGDAKGSYVLQYEAGRGPLALSGDMAVTGTVKDFGVIDRRFWDTFVVPYGVFRMRVGVAGRDDLWGPWVEIRVEK